MDLRWSKFKLKFVLLIHLAALPTGLYSKSTRTSIWS